MFARASKKTITGTVMVFRIDSINQIAANALTEFTQTNARIIHSSGPQTLAMTNFQLTGHATEFSTDSADALMEELNFTCTNVDFR
jgi:hypothetical protein